MSNFALYLIVFGYWALSVSYCLRWHHRQGNLKFDTFLVALLIGPAIVYILIAHDYSIKKEREELEERERNDRHRRWFQTMGLINRNAIPDYGRTIPPPPPISRVERARSERDEAIRMARERIEPPNRRPDIKLKGFKFFH
jgi:hypothetical protein